MYCYKIILANGKGGPCLDADALTVYIDQKTLFTYEKLDAALDHINQVHRIPGKNQFYIPDGEIELVDLPQEWIDKYKMLELVYLDN